MEILVKAIESKYPDDNRRAFLLPAGELKEKDKAKQIALMWSLSTVFREPTCGPCPQEIAAGGYGHQPAGKLYRQLSNKRSGRSLRALEHGQHVR